MKIVHNPKQGKWALPTGYIYKNGEMYSNCRYTKEQFLKIVEDDPEEVWIFSDTLLSSEELFLEMED